MSDAHRCTLAESGTLIRRVRRSCAACSGWINGLILSIALAIALMSVGLASGQIVDMNTFTCDPPPLKWSDLRYVFDIKEDRNGKEAIQA
jgi:hypothetical protein